MNSRQLILADRQDLRVDRLADSDRNSWRVKGKRRDHVPRNSIEYHFSKTSCAKSNCYPRRGVVASKQLLPTGFLIFGSAYLFSCKSSRLPLQGKPSRGRLASSSSR